MSKRATGGRKSEPESHTLFKKHLFELRLGWQQEVKFHPIRGWKWDFAIFKDGEPLNIGIEICGQIWRKGGHSSGKGIQRDYDKGNAGAMLGWRVLHFSTEDIMRGRAKMFLALHLAEKLGQKGREG